jgi:RecB family exonuclease
LETTIDNDKKLNQDSMYDAYKYGIKKFDPNNELTSDLLSTGKVLIDEFFDQNIDTKFNIYDKEYEINFIIGNYLIIGYIDRIDVANNQVTIIDYKTR